MLRHVRPGIILAVIMLLTLLISACDSTPAQKGQGTGTAATTGGQPSFPTTAPALRVPSFGSAGQVAPTVGLVTVFQNPVANDFDTVTVDVQNMPPNNKFTVFFTELSAKPFGHAEYVGDVITRGDGSGESVFHLITFVAFAADNRNPGTSQDQSGTASGIQLEHVGIWFDGLPAARAVLHNPTLAGTPFDGGHGALHAGPQALTDGQTLPVI